LEPLQASLLGFDHRCPGPLFNLLDFFEYKLSGYFFFLRAGVTTTIRMTLIAFPIATVIGLFVGLCRISKNVFFSTWLRYMLKWCAVSL
jgi:ABC-type amino acid transport system permease subunit